MQRVWFFPFLTLDLWFVCSFHFFLNKPDSSVLFLQSHVWHRRVVDLKSKERDDSSDNEKCLLQKRRVPTVLEPGCSVPHFCSYIWKLDRVAGGLLCHCRGEAKKGKTLEDKPNPWGPVTWLVSLDQSGLCFLLLFSTLCRSAWSFIGSLSSTLHHLYFSVCFSLYSSTRGFNLALMPHKCGYTLSASHHTAARTLIIMFLICFDGKRWGRGLIRCSTS